MKTDEIGLTRPTHRELDRLSMTTWSLLSQKSLLVLLAVVCLGLVSCTKKLEQKSADLERQLQELRSREQGNAQEIAAAKTKASEVNKTIEEYGAKLSQLEKEIKELTSGAEYSKGREQKLSDDLNKMSGKLDQAVQMMRRLEQDVGSMKDWQEKETRRREATEKKAEMDRQIQEHRNYARASLEILDRCEQALTAPPYLAASLVKETRQRFSRMQHRFQDQLNTEINERLNEVVEMVERSSLGTSGSLRHAGISRNEYLDQEGKASLRVPTAIESVRGAVLAMLEPQDRLRTGPTLLR